MSVPPLTAVNPLQSAGRVVWVDALRAYAIIAILVTHALPTDGAYKHLVEMFTGSASLFFMTSGALILPVTQSPGRFWWRRMRTYVPQALFWLAAYGIMQHYLYGNYDLPKQLTWGFYAPTWAGGWFLYTLTGLYLIAPFISPWIERASRGSVELFLGLWLISGVVPVANHNFVFPTEWTVFAPFYGFAGYMIAGYYLARWPIGEATKRRKIIFWGIFVLVGIAGALRVYVTAERWGYSELLDSDLSINVMAVNMGIFAAFSGIKRLWMPFRRVCTYVSMVSLELYLVHFAVLRLIAEPLDLCWTLTAVITIVISLVIAWPLHYLRIK